MFKLELIGFINIADNSKNECTIRLHKIYFLPAIIFFYINYWRTMHRFSAIYK